MLKRFEQEFRAASRLNHPNIVRALDYGNASDTPYLVMEFIDGESLGQKIERNGRMSEADAIQIIAQVAQGLHRAHKQNLIHRDVKPDNILVTAEGVAKLADLGLVKETETDLNLTKTGRGLGTPHFMAPEQFRNAKGADVRCDIYSLGATLYQMVTGELPFRSSGPLDAWMKKIQNDMTPPRTMVPTLSERIDWAIIRAMSADPNRRPTSCREFVEDLTGHSTRRVPTAASKTPTGEMWYLVYKDENGTSHTVKGSTSAIRRSLKDGLLGDAENVRASRAKIGPFESLKEFPEFRDMLVMAAPLNMPSGRAASSSPSSKSQAKSIETTTSWSPGDAATPRDASVPTEAPMIDLEAPADSQQGMSYSWLMWVFFLALAVASAGLAYWIIPIPK